MDFKSWLDKKNELVNMGFNEDEIEDVYFMILLNWSDCRC